MKKLVSLFLATLLALSMLTAATAATHTDKAIVKQVQQALNDAGYNCGKPDGAAGKKTAAAITQYQTDKGMDVTGVIDDALLESMGLAQADTGVDAGDGEEAVPVQEKADVPDAGIHIFANIPWYATSQEVLDYYEMFSAYVESSISDKFSIHVWEDDDDVEDWARHWIKDVGMSGWIDSGDYVFGIPCTLDLEFSSRPDREPIPENAGVTKVDAVFNLDNMPVMLDTLIQYYGEPAIHSNSLEGGSDEVYVWRGEDNTGLVLYADKYDAHLVNAKTDVVSYASQEQIESAQAVYDAEIAALDAEAAEYARQKGLEVGTIVYDTSEDVARIVIEIRHANSPTRFEFRTLTAGAEPNQWIGYYYPDHIDHKVIRLLSEKEQEKYREDFEAAEQP